MDILIATANRREVVGISLASLIGQVSSKDRIIVLDNGELPMFSNWVNRMVWDILGRQKVNLIYLRIPFKCGIMKARKILLEQVKENFMFLDDDSILNPNYVQILKKHLNSSRYNFVEGLYLLPNNEIQKPDFSTEILKKPLKKLRQNQWAYFQYYDELQIPIDYGNISGTLFKYKCKEKILKEIKKYPDNAPLEDFVFTHTVGKGLLVTSAIQWHLMNPEEKRDWRYILEDLLRQKFATNPQVVKNFLKK